MDPGTAKNASALSRMVRAETVSYPGQTDRTAYRAITQPAEKYDIRTETIDPGFETPVSDYNCEAYREPERAIGAVFPGVVPTSYVVNAAGDSRFFAQICGNCCRFAPLRASKE